MRRVLRSCVFSLAVCCLPAALRADVSVTNQVNLTQLQITSSSGTVQLTVNASAFGAVFDSLGGFNFGSDTGPVTASTSAATTLANWAGAADSTALTASSSSSLHIPGTLSASAGTVNGGTYGDLQGTLMIVGTSDPTASVTFQAALSGDQTLTTEAFGVFASSEVIFNFVLNGTTSELFLDMPKQIGPSASLSDPFSTGLTNSDTLLTNTSYTFDAQVDAESFGVNTPEPSLAWLTGIFCILVFARRPRRAR